MGKNTKIICTVVPNPYKTAKDKDGKYYFSVFLTPRLPDSGRLMDYYELIHWHEFWDFFRKSQYIKVKIARAAYEQTAQANNYSIGEIEANPKVVFDATELNILKQKMGGVDYSEAGTEIYKQLFLETTPVSGWILDEGEPSTAIQDIINFSDLKSIHKSNPFILEKIKNAEAIETPVSLLLQEIEALTPKVEKKLANSGSVLENSLTSVSETFEEPLLETFQKDVAGHKVSADEIRFKNKENQEFHKKLSILSNYPHLMRLTGWVLDFSIENDPSKPMSGIFKTMAEYKGADLKYQNRGVIKLDLSQEIDFIKTKKPGTDFNKWANFFNEIDFKTPWTYFQPSDFSIKYSEVFENKYFNVKKGFISNTPLQNDKKLLSASQFDMREYISSKIHDFQSPMSQNEKNELNKNVTDDKKEAGKYSTGISVYVDSKVLKTAILNNPDSINLQFADKSKSIVKQLGEVNIEDYILFGHNIDTGYRIDVARVKSSEELKFYSLCKRVANYYIDKNPHSNSAKPELLLFRHEDEPWISESAQAGSSGTLYVDEELFRWNNWSLTCPHIGTYPQDESISEIDETQKEFNDIELDEVYPYMNNNNKPLGGPLLPLRFGQKYAFRIRMVDLCGNGPENSDDVPSPQKSEPTEKYVSENPFLIETPEYKRFEKIEPVELFFEKNIYLEVQGSKSYKEILEDGSEKSFPYSDTQRMLLPDYLGEDLRTMVIRSFVNEKGEITSNNKTCVRFISAPRVTPHLAELHGVFDKVKKSFDLYDFLADENKEFETVHKDGIKKKQKIRFITDPLVQGVKLVTPEGETTKKFEANPSSYFEREYVKLCLNDPSLSATSDDKTIATRLTPGDIQLYTLVPTIDGVPKEGFLSMRFIHAVQKPVFIKTAALNKNAIEQIDLLPINRTPEEPLKIYVKEGEGVTNKDIPMGTTGELRLVAKYTNYVKKQKEELDFTKDTEDGYKSSETQVTITSFSNLSDTLAGENGQLKIPKLIVDKEDIRSLLADSSFKQLEHSFGDTKYREVAYELELVSRFKEFISNDYKEDGFFSKDLRFLKVYPVLNSQKPRSLQIDKIVPVFNWETKSASKSVTRTNDTFRVYFKDEDWFSTGKGEAIAVLYKEETTKEENITYGTNSVEDGLNGLVTEFGKDPTVAVQKTNQYHLSTLFASDNTIFKGPFKVSSVLVGREKSKFSEPTKQPVKTPLSFVPFSIKYNGEQFYCDIKLKKDVIENFYFPFVKFAIARYQDNSITKLDEYDYRFSNVTTTPQAQALPRRELAVTNDNKITLNTFGITKTDKAKIKNEFWLITELDVTFEKVAHVMDSNSASKATVKVKEVISTESIIVLGDKILLLKAGRVYIEEYEYYEIGEHSKVGFQNVKRNFEMNTKDSGYNPRNDVRKRLVFTYELNELSNL